MHFQPILLSQVEEVVKEKRQAVFGFDMVRRHDYRSHFSDSLVVVRPLGSVKDYKLEIVVVRTHRHLKER